MQVKNITFVSIFFISSHYEPGKLFLTGATFFWSPPVYIYIYLYIYIYIYIYILFNFILLDVSKPTILT